MEHTEIESLLSSLIENWEDEVVEFKQAQRNYDTGKIGKYFSALANEANLHEKEQGWLVFGVHNKTRNVNGSEYRNSPEQLNALKMQLAQGTDPSFTFRRIHELTPPEGRVLIFEIPSAPKGIPIAWNGHYYARAGESLTSLSLHKLEEIRTQTRESDWTAEIVKAAGTADLDETAVSTARNNYIRKYANRFSEEEILSWPLETFLDRAKLTRGGRITRACLLLIGRPEADHYLLPQPAQITWKLEDQQRAYEHFGPPFLLSTSALYQKIRNYQIRILPDDALFAMEVSKYDKRIILEALHNCIAHQDYRQNGRILVAEYADHLLIENRGTFFEGTPKDYIEGNRTPKQYRNTFLAQAMAELNMIDTMGYGIHEMYLAQAKRFFPMPDYNLDNPNEVHISIYGKVVDPAYTKLLMKHTNLSMEEILALDRVQKHLSIDDAIARRLRRSGFIEGRKPNLHVSAPIADVTAKKAEYIRTRAQDDEFYKKLICDYIDKFHQASRKDIDSLLWDKLSDALSEEEKQNKISNLLTNLRRAGTIQNKGSKKASEWVRAE
ncbi:MAG: putative DNA binding domain-containing protein [Spirochaetia bacterium]